MWNDHLDRTGSRRTIIENHVTRFILVHICSICEQEIRAAITTRAKKSGDEGLATYMESLLERRTPAHPDMLKDVLKQFGGGSAEAFRNRTTEEDVDQYRTIVENRNKSAHGRDIQMNFREVCVFHPGAKKVIAAFGYALGTSVAP